MAYEAVKRTCNERGVLWEDPEFPVTQSSVFYHQQPPFHFVWKRATEVCANANFVLDSCDTFDVIAGKLGDPWLVSCLGILYLNKGLFYRVVPADQKLDSSYGGIFRFRLWWCGQWMEVLVDDRLPTIGGKLAFLQTSYTGQVWPALLEKAYAKLHGSYEALKYGRLLDGLTDLTGGITESVTNLADTAILAELLKTSTIVTAPHNPKGYENKLRGILQPEMNYRIYELISVETPEGNKELVRLGRPRAPGELDNTHVILDVAEWKRLPAHERERLTTNPKGFWMLYSDFQKVFSRLEIVHLDTETCRAEATLADKLRWQMRIHQGSWRRGVTAGGCRNNPQFHMNPQIQVVLPESDTVIISLNQHSVMDPRVIGFSVYKLPKMMTDVAKQLLFRKLRSTINSQYTNCRQISYRCELDSGSYLIIPTTFYPRQETNFTLRIFSKNSLKMKVLDETPHMAKSAISKAPLSVESSSFAQYEAVFLQLADELKTMDVFVLQELLEACLPNDYIKSCASIDTCRQIVLTMDKNGTGRISLSDFKHLMCSLKHWQQVFKAHAREKMGVIRAERFRDALREVGFAVSERVLQLLVIRYMRKDGMLRFGDFVSAVMHLNRAFDIFLNSECTQGGTMTVNLTEPTLRSVRGKPVLLHDDDMTDYMAKAYYLSTYSQQQVRARSIDRTMTQAEIDRQNYA